MCVKLWEAESYVIVNAARCPPRPSAQRLWLSCKQQSRSSGDSGMDRLWAAKDLRFGRVSDADLGLMRLKVLYIFAGRKRRNSVAGFLRELARVHGLHLEVLELDISRNKNCDFTLAERAEGLASEDW